MENHYGISDCRVPKHSSLSPVHNFPLLNRYCHQLGHVVDQYLSHDVYTTALKNLNSQNLRYLESGRSYLASSLPSPSSSVLEHQPSVGYMSNQNHSNNNRNNELPTESSRQSSSSLPFNNTPLNMEDEVLVLDGLPANLPVDRTRSSFPPLANASSSSFAGGKKYKTQLCLTYMQTGFCRFGENCQFAHGKKEQNPVPFSYKSVLEAPAPCKNFHYKGTCSSGSECHFRHHETLEPTPAPPPAPAPTPEPAPAPAPAPAPTPAPAPSTETMKPDEPTNSTTNLKSINWSPLDDDIEIEIEEDFETHINKVLYGSKDGK